MNRFFRLTAVPRSWLWAAGLSALALYAVTLAFALRPLVMVDDAAISFRYAERIAAGRGFTYNDHERVLGASNPLYTLVLAGFASTGIDVERAARGLDVALFAGCVLLAAVIAARLANPWAGLLAGLLLATNPFFRYWAMCGMESGLAVLLGLSVVLALITDRPALAAVFLGLAVWNKLDAGMLALAVAAAWMVVRRTLPLKVAVLSTLVALPWFAFALWYFGSPIPHSMMVKLANNTGAPASHLWVVREFFSFEHGFIPLLLLSLALFAPPLWRTMDRREQLATATLAGWFVLHVVAFSAVWMGDIYNWYLTALCPPLIILGSAAAFGLLQRIPQLTGRPWLLTAAGVVGLLWVSAVPPIDGTLTALQAGMVIGSEVFDFDRRLAGLFLAQYASPSETVGSLFGWVAYEAPNPFDDYSGLNSRKLRPPEAYWVMHGVPPFRGFSRPVAPAGFVPLATFNLLSDLAPGTSWFTVFGRPESVVARSGRRFVELRLFELGAPEPYSAEYGLGRTAIAGNDLVAAPPSGATFAIENVHQPVRLIFTPVFNSALSENPTHAVTFELRANDKPVHDWNVLPNANEPIVTVALRGAEYFYRLRISFITKAGEEGGQGYDGVRWRSVKVLIGDAYVDLARFGNNLLARQWAEHNGLAESPTQ